jgi:hypothetical protein
MPKVIAQGAGAIGVYCTNRKLVLGSWRGWEQGKYRTGSYVVRHAFSSEVRMLLRKAIADEVQT